MIFNREQNNVINNALHHIRYSSEQVYQFAGKAGTASNLRNIDRCKGKGAMFAYWILFLSFDLLPLQQSDLHASLVQQLLRY